MNFEEQQTPISDHFLDCFEGSISYLPFSLYNLGDSADVNNDDSWRVQSEDLHHELINNIFNFYNNPVASDSLPPSSSSTKRKTPDDSPSKNHQKVQNDRTNGTKHGDSAGRKSGRAKKATAKPRGNNCDNGNNNKETWAGQLLNPCAAAISTGNLTRAQHLLCVLHELASLTGDANCRLAAHGLTALTHHPSSSGEAINYASMNPGFFRQSLIKFNDINPWFTIPNNIANSSILQILSTQKPSSNLHILDIGVSHGVQWPILLEALTRQPNGPPPLVRLTVIMPAIDNNQTTDAPFVNGPPGYDFTSKLLSFATDININLHITRLENHSLQNLNANVINSSPDDTLIICAQFRLHNLSHNPDERTEFMRVLRSLEPKGVILSENNMDCACNNCGDFATAFSRRLEYLWIFLHSTGTAFKGHESEERRMMEGEAAKALTDLGEMNERKEKWCERMRSVGFIGEVFGENVMDGARSLLKKYDNKWEMKVDESDGCVGLQWTGQPVSFCSLWKIDTKPNAC